MASNYRFDGNRKLAALRQKIRAASDRKAATHAFVRESVALPPTCESCEQPATKTANGYANGYAHACAPTASANTCPRCNRSHVTATDARTCCPPSAEQLAARAKLPGYAFHAAALPINGGPVPADYVSVFGPESHAQDWIDEADAEHARTVAKVEAMAADEIGGAA